MDTETVEGREERDGETVAHGGARKGPFRHQGGRTDGGRAIRQL